MTRVVRSGSSSRMSSPKSKLSWRNWSRCGERLVLHRAPHCAAPPPQGFSTLPVQQSTFTAAASIPTAKRVLTSPEDVQEAVRRRVAEKKSVHPPVSGILTKPIPDPASTSGNASRFSYPDGSSGISVLDKVALLERVHTALKGIATVANASNKLNLADKTSIVSLSQDILAYVATLEIRYGEKEQEVTALKLKCAQLELSVAQAQTLPAPHIPCVASSTSSADSYASRLKLPKGQLNLQGSKVAITELSVIAGELGLNLVLVQEQHQHPRVLGCGTNPKADLLPVSSRFIVTLLHDLCNEHCVVGHVSCQSLSMYVVSLYCQYSHDISLHLQHLTHVMDQLSGHPILIGVDSNTHSLMWHCERRQWAGRGPDTEYRKSQMEGFILGRNLLVHNVKGQPPTFHSPNGSSNVDITISTRSVRVAAWKVHEGVSVSDHQLITFGVILGDSRMYDGTEFSDNGCYFRERGVNWGGFCSTLHARISQLRLTLPRLMKSVSSTQQYSFVLRGSD
ncbi:unnamed protein product [Parnassius apollo]|uniref:(apollo) hypothetical protein n=1 Tax=Parnassius apollo TaxID=110799 RepID=A0A8S3WW66_PARAO|nr:unnamed protein product [Parnassius apollo]